jgi:hypothetical protein
MPKGTEGSAFFLNAKPILSTNVFSPATTIETSKDDSDK